MKIVMEHEIIDRDKTHVLTADGLFELKDVIVKNRYHIGIPQHHNLTRPNIHLNGCPAAPIPA